MPTAPLRDYYRILQVHPEAEKEVIEAAYRRLMRKYHPDMLSTRERQDPEAQRRGRELNEAYEVLGDPERRAEYDAAVKKRELEESRPRQPVSGGDPNAPQSNVEKRLYPTRCSKTGQEFHILLVHRKGSRVPFRVTGMVQLEGPARRVQPGLAAQAREALFERGVNALLRSRTAHASEAKTGLPSNQELDPTFDDSLALDLGDIDWAGFKCPACDGEYTHPDGTLSTWGVCGKCSHLYCAGGIRRTSGGDLVTCPWCGARRPVRCHVRAGAKSHNLIQGAITILDAGTRASEWLLRSQRKSRRLPPGRSDKRPDKNHH